MYDTNEMTEQQTALNQHAFSSQFSCNTCKQIAQQPVVTICGHLFCWHCVHDHKLCEVCKKVISDDQLVPIYTSYETKNRNNINHIQKPKPKAKNIGKIRNAAAIGGRSEIPMNVTLNDNIQRGVLLGGSGYFASTAINSMGSFDDDLEELQTQENDGVKNLISNFSWFLLIIIFVCMLLSLNMQSKRSV